jgi:4-hydroxy-2-oxoheptanedioate aldolase
MSRQIFHTTKFTIPQTQTMNGHSTIPSRGMATYRAPSLFQPHRTRKALRDAHEGKVAPLIGFFCGWASPPIGRVVAQMGFDIVCVDWEHSSCNVETMTQMVHDIQFISEGKSMAFVRYVSANSRETAG